MTRKELLNKALLQKVNEELQVYRRALLEKPPEQILLSAHAYSVREDIAELLEYTKLPEAEARVLLCSDTPLQDIYERYINSESVFMEEIEAAVFATAEEKLTEQQEKQNQEQEGRLQAVIASLFYNPKEEREV